MSDLRFWLFFLACMFQAGTTFAQNRKYIQFTVNDGLPSNNVYQMTEDDKGFFWVATDAGIAKFDGKKFQVFTTKQGLPDNDVFYLEKEKDGRIWVSDFKSMAYFDETKNRFVVPIDEETLNWFNSVDAKATNLFPVPMKNGGVFFVNHKYYMIFKNGKLTEKGERKGKYSGIIIEEFEDNTSLVLQANKSADKTKTTLVLYHYKGEKITDSLILEKDEKRESAKGGVSRNGKIYLYNPYQRDDEVIVISDIKTNPIRVKKDTIKTPSPIINSIFTVNNFSEISIYFSTHSGKIFVYDTETLKLKSIFDQNFLINGYGEDSKGNQYISTVDRGMLMFRKQDLEELELPESFSHRNFLSIAANKNGQIFAGNYYGEIAEFGNGKFQLHQTNNIVTAKIRKILFSGNAVYTFSEQGIFKNFQEQIFLDNRVQKSFSIAKTAEIFNDSVILIGAHIGLFSLNTKTQENRKLIPNDSEIALRITAIAKADENSFYFGSVNGLYKYDFRTDKYVSLQNINPEFRERIAALCHTPDGLLWASTASNKILVLKEDKSVLETLEINASVRNIAEGKANQILVSTSNGITIIDYKLNQNKLSFEVKNLTKNDGLLSNEISETVYQNGKIYVATSNGISVIPENFEIPKGEVRTYLTQIFVNQKELEISENYKLKYGEQDLQLQFSGVDLNGNFNHFQYALDKSDWVNFDGQTLAIQLSTGKHQLKIRAVDSNGGISPKILTLGFDVEIPFWQQFWFWVSLGVLTQIVLYFIISRYLKRKKEAEFARKTAELQTATLEQQAFTSLMNPHFIFNALNSIQHYINVQDRKSANRYLSDFASLIRKSFDTAQHSFIPLEEEIDNIKVYLNMEKMRFAEQFTYSIETSEDFDPEDWMIPTMLLQPLLENALLHGIMPSSAPCHITIGFYQKGEDLLVEITDNGIGVENSKKLKAHSNHKSSGLALIKKRIAALGKFSKKPMTFTMEPAFDNSINTGNKISIFIPSDLASGFNG
ncbi:MAG: histidine kinase [Flavobacteriaceae bacterium]